MKSKATGSMWLNSAGRYLSRPKDVASILQARLRELINPPPPITTATSPLVARCERYRKGFLNRIVPWQKIQEASWEKFPYHIDEHDKNLLMECMSTRLNPKIRTRGRRGYGSRLDASSGRILLQSMPGTEVYRYKLVRTLARSLQVPLLELQTHDLPPYVFQDRTEQEESMSEDEIEDEDDDDDDDDDEDEKTACRRLREGDRVKYVGPRSSIKVNRNRKLSSGQRGEVREVKRDKIAVIFYTSDEKGLEPPVHWLNAKDIKRDHDALTHDCYLAMEVLCEVLESHQSIIVYFSDPFCWLSSESSCSTRNEFFIKVKEMFDQLSKCKVLICGQDKSVAGLRDVERNLEELNKGPTITVSNDEDEMRQLFTNVVYVTPIKEKKMFETFRLQLIEDNKAITLRRNFTEMHTVLKENDIMCNGLESIDTKGLILNKMKAEKIVGWATNHYLSTCDRPSVKDIRLHVPAKSVEFAISRIRKQESAISRLKKQNMKAADSKKEKKSSKDLAEGEFEKTFISAVVTPGETGVKFKDVGALEDVKKTLKELVILPLKRPQLFSRGNLLQPCKGLLLFGPPGTGKTLIAKALATESGANFININPSSISSRWFGVEEKLVKALFSFAGKLAPAIIFLDEIDALLGGRGGLTEYEGTRRMRNEFMSAWDGLRSKGSQRILVIGATNRPFDLDDAVIRRMPRRIYVELPDVENRLKILKIILDKESLEPGFGFEQLAQDTDGYSGSDLKNLCSAAAYRPVQELLENEKNMGDDNKGAPTLRPLTLDDFIQSKAKVGKSVAYGSSTSTELRKWNDEYGEKSTKNLAEGDFERSFVSAVVTPGETGVKFDDVGALEDVKKALEELVILPLKRPQLFSRGNLLQPCKGLLLFGPPGTGKTLIAKALATEAGANFISITPSSLASKWLGDEEKLAKALFSFAGKLAPVIIFLDEIDALLGARGGHTEHEATRRMRNEFMAAWDGLRSKGSQRILVLGATNRPFDLDDAVIRRMPRRIYVDLPNVENRLKILKIILAKESLEPGFGFEQLAQDTDGYSGSDLKNLCVAAAYRPVQELLENEKNTGDGNDGSPTLRPLKLDDFIQSKAKVGKSVTCESSTSIEMRKWNDEYGQGGSRTPSPFGF